MNILGISGGLANISCIRKYFDLKSSNRGSNITSTTSPFSPKMPKARPKVIEVEQMLILIIKCASIDFNHFSPQPINNSKDEFISYIYFHSPRLSTMPTEKNLERLCFRSHKTVYFLTCWKYMPNLVATETSSSNVGSLFL